jgi:hypothetical protein
MFPVMELLTSCKRAAIWTRIQGSLEDNFWRRALTRFKIKSPFALFGSGSLEYLTGRMPHNWRLRGDSPAARATTRRIYWKFLTVILSRPKLRVMLPELGTGILAIFKRNLYFGIVNPPAGRPDGFLLCAVILISFVH